MNKIVIFSIIMFIVVLFVLCIFKINNMTLYSNYASVISQNEKKIDIRDEHKYKILAYYPSSEYKLLNKNIVNKVNDYINNFKNEISLVNVQLNQYYYIIITYDSYNYKDYISYVFHIEYYTGGAHPNHDIWTITYNISQDKIIDIFNLTQLNADILNIFSSISREQLLHNNKIVNLSMMMEGTTPIQENFSRFAFSKDELLLFFPRYQVAPYSSGEFLVKVPYDKIFKNY